MMRAQPQMMRMDCPVERFAWPAAPPGPAFSVRPVQLRFGNAQLAAVGLRFRTAVPVQAVLADVVGQMLLHEICERRVSLRTALRSAIGTAAAKGNYFPLMYAIYGPSNVQFRALTDDRET